MTRHTSLFLFAAALMISSSAMAQEDDPLAPPAGGEAEAPPEPAPASADPEPSSEPSSSREKKLSLSWMRPSYGGLTGFGELISPEVVHEGEAIGGGIGVRAGLVIQHQYLKLTKGFGGASFRAKTRAQVYTLQAAVGVMDLAEISFSLPVVDQETSSTLGLLRDQEFGCGNPELSAKFRAPLDIEMLSLAAYTRLEIPWAESSVMRPKRFPLEEHKNTRWELGTAVSLNFGIASVYTNLGFGLIEGGTQLFHYRFGLALTPIDMVEFAMYYDAFELEGSPRSTGTWGWTATVKFENYFIGVGQDILVLDNGLDDVLDGALIKTAGDTGTAWSISLMAGATF